MIEQSTNSLQLDAADSERSGDRRLSTCSPSLTPETDANEYGGSTFKHAPDTVKLVHADLARKLEIERNALAEALIEMRYGHTDKAERMTVAALAYLENAELSGGRK